MDLNSDSPFKVISYYEKEEHLTKDELEDRKTKEIIDIYQKDKKPSKKKTFFDELWERDHPQEAMEL